MRGTQRAGTYTRQISPSEWWLLATPRGLSMDIQLCVEGKGDIDPAALAAAVATASAACPGARLVRRGRLWVDRGRSPSVRVVAADDFDRAQLDSPLLRRRVLRNGRPGCEVLLVRGSPTTVIFRIDHGAMDGMGALLWQRQVFRALRGEAVESVRSRLNVAEIQREIAAGLATGRPTGSEPRLEEDWRSLLGTGTSRRHGSLWRRRTIDGVHPGVTAKVMRLVAGYGEGQGLISAAVDMRPYLPGLLTTAMASAVIRFRVRGDEDWRDVHASLLEAMNDYRFLADRGDPGTLKVPLPLYRARLDRWYARIRKNDDVIRKTKVISDMASVAHLGAVDLAEFGCGGFTATSYYSLGAIMLVPEVNITEYGGRTEVTVGWREGPGVAERAETLLDWIEEGLSPRAHRVWDGNQTEQPYPPATLTGLFAAQAVRTPEAPAVAGPAAELSYADLAAHAAAVTAALTARGIGRGDRVGLVAGRTPAAIGAIWGILGAGAAYLPIDASYPDARITALLTDAGAAACLLETAAAQRDILPPGCQAIPLDAAAPAPPGAPWPVPGIAPADLACVIYTSGSTGAPKGAEIEHASLVNYARWAAREAGIDASTRMPLIASISFDMAGCAIYLPLLNGGTVLPVADVNAVTLREIIEDHGATHMAITPSHLDLINQSGIRRSAVRVIMTAGELLRRTTALRARDIFGPECAILCQWGPTETTIVNTSHRFDPAIDVDPGIPFGRPMDNNTVYLIDSHGRFVPPGEPGEAYVGGVQVARGYLGRPDLTRQRFTSLADGTRVYRTGDIARLLPTGELAFVSRADDQVKIAGHRIEPAEITQALETHPQVTQAAVIPRTRPGRHDKELCAYLVTTTGSTPADIKQFLAARLPRYMTPAAILTVPAIPRTTNGKTDSRQLPDPFTRTFTRTACDDDPVPGARDDITAAVTGIWAQTLQVDPAHLDKDADFRELGGNSLLLLTMINQVSRTVAADVQAELLAELGTILREPTLGHICDLTRQARIRRGASDAQPIV